MNELVYLKKDEAMTDSLTVAESFGKRHTHVLDRIEQILSDDSAENSAQCFRLSHYKDASGKMNKRYLMNRDGFTFLVMGFTGKKADKWKWEYIHAFNSMESVIREKSTQTWIETRQAGMLTRKAETDTIKRLVEYAKEQGSTHADMLYVTYTKLANHMAGIQKREQATVMQLNNLSLMEHIILHIVDTGIVTGKHYKEIYKDCKSRLQTVTELAYIGGAT
jgi:Rha family phage regulatory protein